MNICATVGCDNHTEGPYCDRCAEELAGVPLTRGEAFVIGMGLCAGLTLLVLLIVFLIGGIR